MRKLNRVISYVLIMCMIFFISPVLVKAEISDATVVFAGGDGTEANQ